MPVQILPITMTIQRAAAETGIPRSNLYELWRRGEIEIRKSGRRSLVTGESMTRYLENLPIAEKRNPVAAQP
jgi:excisionase family DNA binding protein